MALIFLWHISLPVCQWKIQPFSDSGVHAVAVECRQMDAQCVVCGSGAFSVAGWSWVSSAPGFMEETALIL